MWLAVAAVVLLTLGLTVTMVAEPMRVHAESMAPTLTSGQEVLVLKLGRSAHRPPRGSVIAFRVPQQPGLLIKRVVGVAGDSVGIEDGVLVVNGRSQHESFVDYAATDTAYFGPVTVPAGAVFTLGDNRAHSIDSRVFGAVPLNRIVGRVLG